MVSKKTVNLITKDKIGVFESIGYGFNMLSKYAENWKILVGFYFILSVIVLFLGFYLSLVIIDVERSTGFATGNLFIILGYIAGALVSIICLAVQLYLLTDAHVVEWNIIGVSNNIFYYLYKSFIIIIFNSLFVKLFTVVIEQFIITMTTGDSYIAVYILLLLIAIFIYSILYFIFNGMIYEYVILNGKFLKSLVTVLNVVVKDLPILIFQCLLLNIIIGFLLAITSTIFYFLPIPYVKNIASIIFIYGILGISFFASNIKYLNIKYNSGEYRIIELDNFNGLSLKNTMNSKNSKGEIDDVDGSRGGKINYKSYSFKIDE